MENTENWFTQIFKKVSSIYDMVLGNYIRNLFKKPSSILFLGIDNAGKTTLVKKLKHGVDETYIPTHHPKKTEIQIGNLKATIVDLGGHKAARIVWTQYFFNCDGIVFIVDVSDTERFDEVREAYEQVRKLERKAPIAVLMNKIDKVDISDFNAWSEQIKQEVNIYDEPGCDNSQPVSVNFVSIVGDNRETLTGPLAMSFKWLEMMINKQRNN